jgi:hypothetical protein
MQRPLGFAANTIDSRALVCRRLVFKATTIGLGMQRKSSSSGRADRKREKAFGAALNALRGRVLPQKAQSAEMAAKLPPSVGRYRRSPCCLQFIRAALKADAVVLHPATLVAGTRPAALTSGEG